MKVNNMKGGFIMSKLKSLYKNMSKKGQMNLSMASNNTVLLLVFAVIAIICLYILVTFAGLTAFSGITEVETIKNSTLEFVVNVFSLLGVAGTLLGVLIFVGVAAVVIIVLRRVAQSSSSGGFSG